MSVKQMGTVWDLDLAPNQRLVLLAYADHADDEGGSIFPSLARVAHKTGYSRDQVRRISKELVAANLMVRVSEATPGRGAEYRLTLDRGSKLPPFKPRGGGANDPPQVGAPMQPKPSVEPSGSRRDASASPEVKNWFTFYCELANTLDVIISPEDRKATGKHFKDLLRLHEPNEAEIKKVISKMLEARASGYDMSPQKALSKVRGNNVIQLRPEVESRPGGGLRELK